MTDAEKFKLLEERYGNHSDVARALGISPRRYRAWRAEGLASLHGENNTGTPPSPNPAEAAANG